MATIIHRHLTKRLLFAVFLVLLGLVAPLILVSWFGHLPPAALYTEFLWPALCGTGPGILYLALPIADGIGTTWYYGAPLAARQLQDVVNIVQTAPTPALLQPYRCSALDGGKRVIYFEERID